MFGVGILEALVVVPLMVVVPLVVLYWVIRLGVRHGIRDTTHGPGR